ncbi:MAG: HEPN domain-containing protein [Clostridiales bacterium]|jgi:HEPN domain-containing protein|nr:HEPN domain-containing protein [Clostridiales bacterium]
MAEHKSLLDGAKADLNVSRVILSAYDDDLSVNLAAYHVQQAVEKALKFRINMLGEIYPLTHNIEHLTDKLLKLGDPVPDWLLIEANRITEYENKARYVLGFVTSKNKISSLITLTEELIKQYMPFIT